MVRFQRLAPVFPVRNVGAALEHYRRLGFEAEPYEEESSGDPIYGFLARGPIQIHVARVTDLDPLKNTSACYLYVDDANSLFEEWTAAKVGGRVYKPVDTPYGLREFSHVDPDGNLLRVGSRIH